MFCMSGPPPPLAIASGNAPRTGYGDPAEVNPPKHKSDCTLAHGFVATYRTYASSPFVTPGVPLCSTNVCVGKVERSYVNAPVQKTQPNTVGVTILVTMSHFSMSHFMGMGGDF